jgi:hypothetical protein
MATLGMDLNEFMGQYGYQSININNISMLYNTGISDPMISQIMRMKLNHVFVNPMMFTNNGNEYKHSDILRESWEEQLKIIMRHVWCCGFGACINKYESRRLRNIESIIHSTKDINNIWEQIKKKYKITKLPHTEIISDLNFLQNWANIGAEPDDGLWLDEYIESDEGYGESLYLSQLLIFAKKDWSSNDKYVYFIPIMTQNGRTFYVRIRNVFTLKDDGNRNSNNIIMSRVSQLLPAINLQKKSQQCYEVSMSSRAAPNIPFETDTKGKNDFDIDMEIQNNTEIGRIDVLPRNIRGDNQREIDNLDVLVTTKRIMRPYQDEKDPNVPIQSYNVPKGLKIGKQPESHDPTYFNEVSQMLWVEGFGLFEIPQGLISMYSLHTNKALETTGDLKGKTLSIDSLPYRLFQESNDRLAKIFISYMNKVIGYSMIKPISQKVAKDLEIDQIDQIDVDSNVLQVMMPKNPDADKILSLMAAGILKYEIGIQMLAKALGIDVGCFNKQQPKDLEQLVGIKRELLNISKPAKKKVKK